MDVQTQVRRSACIAHNGKVTCVEHTPDGRFLVSAGTDQMRCWNLSKGGINVLAHYEQFTNPCVMKSWMLAVQPSQLKSPVVVHPIGNRDGKDGTIGMYDMLSGRQLHTLEGHWERSNCGCFIDTGGEMEILTGGTDGNLMTFRYGGKVEEPLETGKTKAASSSTMSRVWGGEEEEDAWSD